MQPVAGGFVAGDGNHVVAVWHAVNSRLVRQVSVHLASFVSDGNGEADVRRLEQGSIDEINDLALLRLASGSAPALRLDVG